MRILNWFLLVCGVVLSVLSGCNTKELQDTVYLELDRSVMRMTLGQTQKLNAVLKGASDEAGHDPQLWKSDAPSIASVDESGLVKALSAGTANVTVTVGELSKSCQVIVSDFKAASLEMNEDFEYLGQDKDSNIKNYAHKLAKGTSFQIEPKFYNADGEKVNEQAYPKYEIIESVASEEGSEVVTVDENGLLQAVSAGTAVVKVSGAGQEAHVKFTVVSITMSHSKLSLYVKQSELLTAVILPQSYAATAPELVWKSSDEEYVTVNAEGLVIALQPTDELESPVSITAVCDDVVAVCEVSVVDYTIDVMSLTALEGLKNQAGEYEMLVGDKPYDLCVKFEKDGEDVTDIVNTRYAANLIYESSDNEVADVVAGFITAKSPGTTDITVSFSGKTQTFTLIVTQSVESLAILAPTNPHIVNVGVEDFRIEYELLPDNVSVKGVVFSSTDTSVATVDPVTGVVSVHKAGNTVINVTSDGNKRPYVDNAGEVVVEQASANLLIIVAGENSDAKTLTISGEGVENGQLLMKKGNQVQLSVSSEDPSYNGGYLWVNKSEGVVTVTETGLLTAISYGEASVFAVADNGAYAQLDVIAQGINPTAIKIDNGESLEITTGENITLTASPTAPANADFEGVNWYSSDENIVKIDAQGRLYDLNEGEVTITAKARSLVGSSELSDVTASIRITITAPPVEKVYVTVDRSRIEVGESVAFKAVFVPTESRPKNVLWAIVDGSEYASIDTKTGVLTGIASKPKDENNNKWPSASVKVIADGVESAPAAMEIVPIQPKDITISSPSAPLKVGQYWNLNPKVIPENLGLSVEPGFQTPIKEVDGEMYFVSDAPGYVGFSLFVSETQNPGVVTPLTKYFSFNVEPYWVESITIPSAYDMNVGQSSILSLSMTSDVEGVRPTYTDLEWISSRPEIVSVDSRTGEIKALAEGQAVITATTAHNWSVPSGVAQKSAKCVVTVTNLGAPLKEGDYYYSDGTWSTELDASKTVVGVVAMLYDMSVSDVKLKSDYPACRHGMVVGLNQYDVKFTMESGDPGAVSKFASANGYPAMDDLQSPHGYGNTLAYKNHGGSPASLVSLAAHQAEYSGIKGASSWYIPSEYEMAQIAKSYALLNEKLKAISGVQPFEDFKTSWDGDSRSGVYWTSTVRGSVSNQLFPYLLSVVKPDDTARMVSHTYWIRPVFAF